MSTFHDFDIPEEILAIKTEIVENRRWFHAHPELSFKEFETAKKIAELLREYGISEVFENIATTGVVALIRGTRPGPCIALRADIDALPVQEIAEVPYRSLNEGCMHACGHDGHMAGLLGAARILNTQKDTLSGCVKLIFQPAEEGYGGAAVMIKEGVLNDGPYGPKVDAIYGIHLWSFEALGSVCCSDGPVMAASDKFTIEVKGKGGHGAAPQGTVDAIVETAHLITALQTVVSRNKDPLESGVVTCGTIRGGYGYNIIADKVEISGTCRSFSPQTQELIKSRMQGICCGIAHTFGGEIDLKYYYGYPPTVNSWPECVQIVKKAAAKIVGPARSGLPQKTMGAEDFSYFMQAVPGCFVFVGAALPGDTRPHHKSVFDFDEDAMLVSCSLLVQIIRDTLQYDE